MSKTVKSWAVVAGISLALIAVGAITVIWKIWDSWEKRPEQVSSHKESLVSRTDFSLPGVRREENIATEVQEVGGLKFQLLNCTSKAVSSEFKTIVCPYLVISSSEGAELEMRSGKYYSSSGKVRLIDSQGNEHISTQIKFGANTHEYEVTKDLIKDVPIRGEVIFDRVPRELQNITVLELFGELEKEVESKSYHEDIKVQFRKVNLSEI